jgi:hypothetical protein
MRACGIFQGKTAMSVVLALAMAMETTVVMPGGNNGADIELQCETGPVDRDYGGSAFAVFSCSDDKSLVAFAKPGTRAYPYFFILSPVDGQVRLYGEGDGDNEAGRAAFTDLNELKPGEVADLVAATKVHKTG